MAKAATSVRTRALAAAVEVLAEQGIDALKLRALASRAGIGVASMYHYFPNKDHLLAHLAIKGFSDLARLLGDPPESLSGEHAFDRAARAYFAFIAQHRAIYRLMYDHQLMSRHAALRDAEHDAFTVWTAQLAADPRIPASHTASVALTLWTLGRGVAASAASQPDARLDAESRELILRGVAYLIDRGG